MAKYRGLGRKALAAVSCVAAFGGSMAATLGRADAAVAKPKPKACGTCGGYPVYTWQDSADGKYLGVAGAGTANQDLINVQAKDGLNTEWAAVDLGAKYRGWEKFAYINENSGKCLDDYNSDTSGQLKQFACSGYGSRRQFIYSQTSFINGNGQWSDPENLINVANGDPMCRARTGAAVEWFIFGTNRFGGSTSWAQCRWH